jgi:hypothetical protein
MARLLAMDAPLPFCQDCGTVGTLLAGVHPGDTGLVRWAIYRCGHTTTEIVLDEIPEVDPVEVDEAVRLIH